MLTVFFIWSPVFDNERFVQSNHKDMKEVLTGITWIKMGLLLNWRDGEEDNGNLLLKLLGQVTLVHLLI